MSAATVVLVHGAWFAPWYWHPVVQRLEDAGVPTRTVDLPSCGPLAGTAGLAADSAAVSACVREVAGPVLLVGHSYGGMPVSQVGAEQAAVVHVMYVCAFMQDVGESRLDSTGGTPPDWWQYSADRRTLTVRDPATVLWADCPPSLAAEATARLRPFTAEATGERLTAAAWHRVPSSYVVCQQDAALPPEAQRRMARRARNTHELPSGHSPFLSQPDALAGIIASTAGQGSFALRGS